MPNLVLHERFLSIQISTVLPSLSGWVGIRYFVSPFTVVEAKMCRPSPIRLRPMLARTCRLQWFLKVILLLYTRRVGLRDIGGKHQRYAHYATIIVGEWHCQRNSHVNLNSELTLLWDSKNVYIPTFKTKRAIMLFYRLLVGKLYVLYKPKNRQIGMYSGLKI